MKAIKAEMQSGELAIVIPKLALVIYYDCHNCDEPRFEQYRDYGFVMHEVKCRIGEQFELEEEVLRLINETFELKVATDFNIRKLGENDQWQELKNFMLNDMDILDLKETPA